MRVQQRSHVSAILSPRRFPLILSVVCCGIFAATSPLCAQEDLSVIGDWMQFTDAPNTLYHHLSAQAFEQLDERAAEVAALDGAKDWRQRQRNVRQTLEEVVGPFPEKTPLNARVVRTVEKERFRVEHIIYESQPDFYVTASLFLPENLTGKAPAILFCSGHSTRAYRRPYYQRAVLNLVTKGFIVLAFDPVGQGERLQYFNPEKGESSMGSTHEHSYPGAQAFMSGSSQARHMIWDGIRGIDYLIRRPEVDTARIGVHGLSGGGTQSAYIGAFDDRVKAAAPTGYITSYRRLLQSDGPQDGEQNLYHALSSGLDHADLLEVRAPKPTLMVTTTRDFFSIQGARETFQEVKDAYRALGEPEHIQMVEDDHGHGYTEENLEAVYAFFQEHLDLPGSSAHEKLPFLSPAEMQVTETGQVSTALESETVFSLNRERSRELMTALNRSRTNLSEHLPAVREAARQLSGYRSPEETSAPVFTGRYQRDGYDVEKYFVRGEGDYVVPFLLMIPDEAAKHPAVIYLHPEGKAAEAAPGEEMEWFVKNGYVVLAPDLIGVGEMGPGDFTGDAFINEISYNKWFASILIGRSIVGVRAGDVSRLVDVLAGRPEVEPENISGVARREMTPVMLHTAAFENRIRRVALMEPLVSYRSMVMNRFYAPELVHAGVAGALTSYDLPDLAATLAPRELLMANVVDQNGHRASPELIDKDLSVVRRSYEMNGARDHLIIRPWESYQSLEHLFSSWKP